jgi:putative ABC transport system substrate-binding protein
VGRLSQGARQSLGYVEGANLALEPGFSLGNSARFPELAIELVQRGVEVIVAEGVLATAAAKKATRSIPIVMAIVGDPVGSGLVASLPKPGGNITGMTSLAFDRTAKQLQLLKELMPAPNVAFLWNPNESFHSRAIPHVQSAARALGIQVVMIEARNLSELDAAFPTVGVRSPRELSSCCRSRRWTPTRARPPSCPPGIGCRRSTTSWSSAGRVG